MSRRSKHSLTRVSPEFTTHRFFLTWTAGMKNSGRHNNRRSIIQEISTSADHYCRAIHVISNFNPVSAMAQTVTWPSPTILRFVLFLPPTSAHPCPVPRRSPNHLHHACSESSNQQGPACFHHPEDHPIRKEAVSDHINSSRVPCM